jgi:hypothetical protein
MIGLISNICKFYILVEVNLLRLFDVIPDRFFSILSSKNKEFYSDCLFILFNQYKGHTSFGIDREIVVQIFMDYFEGFKEADIFQEEDSNVRTVREKANFIIRKLEECGWIDIETTNSYKQIINLTDYSASMLETFEKIVKSESLEYQGYVYTIYSILFGSENTQYNIIIDQIYENTMKLINGLKTLNSNIKKYIDRITQQKSSEEIMKLHFDGYTQEIIDKAYHRLKTSDNVSKFRPRIIERLEEIKRDKKYIEMASQQDIDMERVVTIEEAKEKIMGQLNDIIYVFENMDDTINEIDRKNTQYIRASLTRVKYLINSSKDIEGQINEILKYIIKKTQVRDIDLKDDGLDEINKMFNVFPQSFIDNKSIYVSNEGKKNFEPQKIDKDKFLSKEERQKLIKEIQEKKKSRLSRGNIDKYVIELMGDRKVINASLLPIENMKDFIKIIYILVYSKSRLVHYRIKRLDKPVIINGYTFNDFEIWRK